jgi:hypothetical protein
VAYRRVSSVVRGRGFLLLPVAAFAVHQLRYTLAYGSHADQVMAAQGHSYLNSLAPWLVLLIAVGAGSFLLRVAQALAHGAKERPRRSFLGLWALSSSGLVAIYVVQELLEELFAVGHPGGVAGVFGHGGAWALPLSLAVGAALAALLRLACAIVAAVERGDDRRAFSGLPPLILSRQSVLLSPRSPLAAAAAGRAPPVA